MARIRSIVGVVLILVSIPFIFSAVGDVSDCYIENYTLYCENGFTYRVLNALVAAVFVVVGLVVIGVRR